MRTPRLTPSQWVAVVLLAGAPLILVLCDIGPGRWMNAGQDAVIGRHSFSLSFLAVLLLEFALIWIVAVAVRWFTGRTLVDRLTRRKSND